MAFVATAMAAMSAASLPSPYVRPLPSKYDWFDGYAVMYGEKLNQPYSMEIVSTSGIKALDPKGQAIPILNFQLTEYQEEEDTPNYPSAQFIITLDGFQMEVGGKYSLYIPAGALNVKVTDSEILPNEVIEYSFTLEDGQNEPVYTPPVVTPEPGEVKELSSIELYWICVIPEYGNDLLNEVNYVDPEANIPSITATCNGEPIEDPTTDFRWTSKDAVTPGSAGDIFIINLSKDGESVADGNYVITIPEGYLQISDIEQGTVYSEKIVLEYKVNNGSTSVNVIGSQDSNNEVYNLNGVKVSDNGLNNLPKGVYISNGKKVVK